MFSYTLPPDPILRESLSPAGNSQPDAQRHERSGAQVAEPAWWSSDASSAGSDHSGLQIDYSPLRPHPQLCRDHSPVAAAGTKRHSHLGKRVPRPRNAFMIFRSAFWAEQKINRDVEHDHRHISRIVGHYWNQMPEEEKDVWRRKADQEKVEHEMRHPGYRFCPMARTKKPVKRKVKRNGADDLLRCKQLADLLLSGKQGDDLVTAARSLRLTDDNDATYPTSPSTKVGAESIESRSEDPPFRSPLLPPLSLDAAPRTSGSSMESSPTGGSSSHQSPRTPPPGYPQRITVSSTDDYPNLLLQTRPFPALTYSVYAHAPRHSMRSFNLTLQPLCLPEQQLPRAVAPRTGLLYDNYSLPASCTVPDLPAPLSNSIIAEPVQWNPAFQFTR